MIVKEIIFFNTYVFGSNPCVDKSYAAKECMLCKGNTNRTCMQPHVKLVETYMFGETSRDLYTRLQEHTTVHITAKRSVLKKHAAM